MSATYRPGDPQGKPSGPPLEPDAADYERHLDDAQLAAFAVEIDRRTNALLAQGVNLPLAQIENHHITGLLEQLVGRAKAQRVREWHLSWVDRRLDDVEATMRAKLLESGLLDSADLPGFP